jgi:hypothetical protein
MGSEGGRPTKSHGCRPTFVSVWSEASWTRVYTRREWLWRWRKSVEAEQIGQPADRHLASYRLGQVGGAPLLPYKYPLPVKVDTHTHHILEIPLVKLSFLV